MYEILTHAYELIDYYHSYDGYEIDTDDASFLLCVYWDVQHANHVQFYDAVNDDLSAYESLLSVLV